MRRSILTEKVSRRGFHLSREYAVDPLEIIFVREVMRTKLVVLPPKVRPDDLSAFQTGGRFSQRLFPVVAEDGAFLGIVTANQLREFIAERPADGLARWLNPAPVVASPDEPLRAVVNRMAEHGLTRLPVVAPGDASRLVGLVSLRDLLHARARNLSDERHRERTLRMRFLWRAEETS
jgi:CBS domain-containing protein